MSLKKKKATKKDEEIKEVVEEEVKEEVVEELSADEIPEEGIETGDPAPVELEVKEAPEPNVSGFRIGEKVILKQPIDDKGRRVIVDMFEIYRVYAIEGVKATLKSQRGQIFITKISNIKKFN